MKTLIKRIETLEKSIGQVDELKIVAEYLALIRLQAEQMGNGEDVTEIPDWFTFLKQKRSNV